MLLEERDARWLPSSRQPRRRGVLATVQEKGLVQVEIPNSRTHCLSHPPTHPLARTLTQTLPLTRSLSLSHTYAYELPVTVTRGRRDQVDRSVACRVGLWLQVVRRVWWGHRYRSGAGECRCLESEEPSLKEEEEEVEEPEEECGCGEEDMLVCMQCQHRICVGIHPREGWRMSQLVVVVEEEEEEEDLVVSGVGWCLTSELGGSI